jgi:hypothetical protein
VELRRAILEDGQAEFRLSSVEFGKWNLVESRMGALVRSQSNMQRFLQKLPTPSDPYVVQCKLVFRPDPQAPDRIYAQKVEPLEAAAELVVSRRKDERRWNQEVRKLMSERLKEYRMNGVAELKVLPAPKFLGVATTPETSLRDLSVWIALDELLQHLPVDLGREASDRNLLELWNEMIGVICGRIQTADNLRVLPRRDFDRIRQAVAVNLVFDFTPMFAVEQPDRHWSIAPRVALPADLAAPVRWRGAVGPGHRKSEWLAIRLSPESTTLTVSPQSDNSGVVWTQVAAPQGWCYLRVVPRFGERASEFDLVVTFQDDRAKPGIEIFTPPPSEVRFPY